ncbi:helix-turn-helix domain-containing protein [Gordonia sp. L191]|uniref:AraC family transcriptional regulator n=1 Tax=Gordonia sp. L191 TaxID=2982699 RepID=UPI0024BFF72B|nr:AraC family transcriptional regulator [Gordonia sp. L191]WHU48504.1 helix-turn-helix domain-containing protein [Gordonia sp. L191]
MSHQIRRRGLPTDLVQVWRRRIGADNPVGNNPISYVRSSGREGLVNRTSGIHVAADVAEDFDEIVFWRPLTDLHAFVILRTPCTVSRSAELIGDHPSPYLVVTTTVPDGGRFLQGDRSVTDDSRDSVLIFDNDQPYSRTSQRISDVAGIAVPVRLLGNESGPTRRTMSPVQSDTPLARAAAAFLRTFACDVAAGGADTDPGSELAAIDLVRALLTQDRSDSESGGDSENIRAATRALVEQYFQDPEFCAETIARSLHMSRRQLYRHFADSEETPATMITERRLVRARELLLRRVHPSLDMVAAACGFGSVSTLRNRFRAQYRMTPAEFRTAWTEPVDVTEVPPVAGGGPADRGPS